MTIGRKIKNCRIEKNMTQLELGKKLGISPSTIGMYEQDRREPDANTIVKFATVFNVSTDYLLGYVAKQDVIITHASIEKIDMAARIRKLRLQKGLTQEELGNSINVQKAAISKYEIGRAVPSVDILIKLADLFGVSADYILGREQGAFSRPLSILERAERELNEDDLQQLEILAKHFLKKNSIKE